MTDRLDIESSTMVISLIQKSEIVPNAVAFRMLSSDLSTKELTFHELLQNVKRCAGQLSKSGIKHGDVCMLIFSQGLEFLVSFLACNWIGAVPVPLNKPARNKPIDKWEKIAEDAEVKAIITNSDFLENLARIFSNSPKVSRKLFVGVGENLAPTEIPIHTPHEISFLQYTSGSTGNPKGVIVAQDSLYHNLKAFKQKFEFNEQSVMVSWLPFYHDMGLILGILQGIFSGYTTVLISPADFMNEPLLWLKAITIYKGTHTGGPNFSIELVASKLTALKTKEAKSQISLTSLKMLICGAEPVHIKTIQRFNGVAKDFDMKKGVVCPGYGLAEATLVVSSNNDGNNVKWVKLDKEQLQNNKIAIKDQGVIDPFSTKIFENDPSAIFFVSNGTLIEEHNLSIRDKDSNILSPFQIGELWFSGPSLTKGYYRKEKITNTYYIKEPQNNSIHLKTGDIGFLDEEGNIYVTGRIKDVIIIKGLNHYPQDIERTVFTSSNELRTDGTAAFSVTKNNQEKLVIIQELTRAALRTPQFEKWKEDIIEAVIKNHEIIVDTIVFVPPMHVPRTTSGKIQRTKARLLYEQDQLRKVLSIYQRKNNLENIVENIKSKNDLRAYILALFANQLGISEESIAINRPFIEMGINSMMSLYIRDGLDEVLTQPVQTTDIYNYNTITNLTNYLWKKENEEIAATTIFSEEGSTDREEENIDHLSEDELLSLLYNELKN